MTKELKRAYKEVLIILNHIEPQYKEKIPKKFLEQMEKNQLLEHTFEIDFSIPFKDNAFSPSTLPLLALINLRYWCETEEDKKAQQAIHDENDKKYREEQREKNDLSKVLKKEEVVQAIAETDTQPFLWLELPEDTWLEKLIYRIKYFFKQRKWRKQK